MFDNSNINLFKIDLREQVYAAFYNTGNLLLFVIPLSYTGLRNLDLYGTFAVMALAQIMSGIVGLIWLKRVLANHQVQHAVLLEEIRE